MRVAMVGLGAIARKAYLPVLGARPDTELVLCTRDAAALSELAATWRVSSAVGRVQELPALAPHAAFVHTATEAHLEVASALLSAGIPVYVDKPLAYDLAGAEALVELAERSGVLLMAGFNRRFAPMVRRAHEGRAADLVLMQKNRVALPDGARRLVFDDFIHVADTLRFFAPSGVAPALVSARREHRRVHHLVLQLQAPGFTGVGIMNRDGGASEERLEVMRPGEKHVVEDLDTLVHWRAGEERHHRAGDWESALQRRGFPAIVEHFLACVSGREAPFQPARDALATHALCEWIVERIDAEAGAGAEAEAGERRLPGGPG